ncbi:hypothetical protein [Gluconacetobacter diazotrophicus]|uniref:Uncharacterized protein n=1 Tax=Gluconacetobacter diazotrophicus (strain ATCC 49037 / DSM 5601 / CCUG 37298 / CIP 103539 / LMG 7603 / PAl5) TaxID=272568 RepID=A9HP85_GLUDA|nr:hypothetical protein [Gluconacetobacter diazotrophicus]CAP56556.1 hypothetical protein GDI2613 [Gluconacetobacter diazotrophicus PA1 5]
MDLLALYNEWSGPAGAVVGLASGWFAKLQHARLQAQKAQYDAGQQALAALDLASKREQALTRSLLSASDEIGALRSTGWRTRDLLEALHAEAIGARLIVHELEAKAGLPLRAFEPLPPYPFPAETVPDGETAGAQAVDAAEPRAEPTHG